MSTPAPPRQKLGVIDIGSNSVRLVVYDVDMKVPFQIFNEKVLCALGRGVSTTGRLNPEGRLSAFNAIRRFSAIAQEMRVDGLIAAATAAVREAADGPDFVRDVEAACDIAVRVLTGEEEARYSAFGVLSGIWKADGLVADLGGSSMELIRVDPAAPREALSLPFGPLRIIDDFGSDFSAAEKAVEAALGAIPWLGAVKGKTFYLVGGSWRALAKIHIDQTRYPLNILHNYEMSPGEAAALAKKVAGLRETQIAEISPNVSDKRLATLPHAAMVMGTILKTVKPGKVVVSGFGLREGLAFDRLFGADERPDLLLAMCRELARTRGRFGDHGDEIQEWVAPLFASEPEDRQRLHHVTCLLSDIGWAGHPDYRAEMVLSDVLHSQLVGVDHAGRAFMAIALYVCYGGKIEKAPLAATMPALPAETVKQAEILGLALRLAQRISGGTEGILAKCDLALADNKIALHIQPGNTHLVSEVVERRLRNLAAALGKDFEIRS